MKARGPLVILPTELLVGWAEAVNPPVASCAPVAYVDPSLLGVGPPATAHPGGVIVASLDASDAATLRIGRIGLVGRMLPLDQGDHLRDRLGSSLPAVDRGSRDSEPAREPLLAEIQAQPPLLECAGRHADASEVHALPSGMR